MQQKTEAVITYTAATELTGLSYWQLRYGVERGDIAVAVPGGPAQATKLLKRAVLEYAETKRLS